MRAIAGLYYAKVRVHCCGVLARGVKVQQLFKVEGVRAHA